MSEASRSTSRWSSSVSTRVKSSNSIITQPSSLSSPLPQKKLYRLQMNNQPSFAQRMAKTRHDVEELFKLYYANNVKFDTFQRQIVTGTRIRSARTSPLIQNNFTNSSSNVFSSKHCVSREQMSPLETDDNEQKIINIESKQIPTKRIVQVRIDHNPTTSVSTSPIPPPPPPSVGYIPLNSNSIAMENPSVNRHDEFNESSLVKSLAFLEDFSTDNSEQNNFKKPKSSHGQRPVSLKASLTHLPSVPSSAVSFINNRKDPLNISHSSCSTNNSSQQNQPQVVTGTAITVCQRSPTKPSWHKQRIKSSVIIPTNSESEQSNNKISKTVPSLFSSSSSIKNVAPEFPVYIGGTQRVVSIPSKCSRYVLVTFPRAPVRYNAPTHVERLLLPERFPTLFQNIVQSCEHNRNNKS